MVEERSDERSARFARDATPDGVPTPAQGENREQFMSRCMLDAHMSSAAADQPTRSRMCYQIWQNEGDMAKGGGKNRNGVYQSPGNAG